MLWENGRAKWPKPGLHELIMPDQVCPPPFYFSLPPIIHMRDFVDLRITIPGMHPYPCPLDLPCLALQMSCLYGVARGVPCIGCGVMGVAFCL